MRSSHLRLHTRSKVEPEGNISQRNFLGSDMRLYSFVGQFFFRRFWVYGDFGLGRMLTCSKTVFRHSGS
jgi:hypothetical protein